MRDIGGICICGLNIYIARPSLGRKLCDRLDSGLNWEQLLGHTSLDSSWLIMQFDEE